MKFNILELSKQRWEPQRDSTLSLNISDLKISHNGDKDLPNYPELPYKRILNLDILN